MWLDGSLGFKPGNKSPSRVEEDEEKKRKRKKHLGVFFIGLGSRSQARDAGE